MGVMGLNPFRHQRRRTSDYLLVAFTLAATLGLVLWAARP
jgi:4-amino-4-deoxy-L-arabinose transferase-like glycosyltransferase